MKFSRFKLDTNSIVLFKRPRAVSLTERHRLQIDKLVSHFDFSAVQQLILQQHQASHTKLQNDLFYEIENFSL